MKKLLALLLVFVMLFAFAACGSEKSEEKSADNLTENAEMTLDEIVSIAKFNSAVSIMNMISDNKAKAKQKLGDKYQLIWLRVFSIEEDYFESYTGSSSINRFRVYLPLGELVKINSGDCIQIVGKISELLVETENSYEGFSADYNVVKVEDAHIVTDEFQLTNVQIKMWGIESGTSTYGDKAYAIVDCSSFGFGDIHIYFDKPTSEYNSGDASDYRITVKGILKPGTTRSSAFGNTILEMRDCEYTITKG